MACLGFLFGLPATWAGGMLVAVGLWLIRGATWARWTAGAIGALISAASLFLVIGLSIVAATAWPGTDR